MKRIITILFTAIFLITIPTNFIYAYDENLDTPVDPVDPDDYVVRQLSGTGSHTFIFNDGYETVGINTSGSGNIDQFGQIESFSLSTSTHIVSGEGHAYANLQLTGLNYVNNGTHITVYYTIKITVFPSGISQSHSGSYSVY